MKKLTEIQLDALREASNIGAGHAAIALSQMMNKKIMIAVVKSDIVPSAVLLKDIAEEGDHFIIGIYLKTLGDTQGAALFLFHKSSALKICDLLLRKESGTVKFVDESCQSALKELGSILTGAFFSVLSDMLGLKFFHKTPCYAADSADVILYGICEDIFGDRKERMCLTTEFIESGSQIRGSFVFIPSEDTMENLLNKLEKYR